MKGLYAIVDTKLLAARKTDPMAYAARSSRCALRRCSCARERSARTARSSRTCGCSVRCVVRPACRSSRTTVRILPRSPGYEIRAHRPGGPAVRARPSHRAAARGRYLDAQPGNSSRERLRWRPRYVAYGPVFETASKNSPIRSSAPRPPRAATWPAPRASSRGDRWHHPRARRRAQAVRERLCGDCGSRLPDFTLKDVTERARVPPRARRRAADHRGVREFALAGLIATSASGAALVGRWPRATPRRRSRDTERQRACGHAPENQKARGHGDDARRLPVSAGRRRDASDRRRAGWQAASCSPRRCPSPLSSWRPRPSRIAHFYVRPAPRASLAWLSPLDAAGSVLLHARAPNAIEHEGIRFERVRRPAATRSEARRGAERRGCRRLPPNIRRRAPNASWCSRPRTVRRSAYRGLELEPSACEVIASGRSTLDD